MRVLPEGSPVFNVCTGRATSVLDVAHTIAALCGVAASIDFAAARAGDARVSVGDPARAAAVLGTRAVTDLHDGLARTLGIAG
jgi:UDP-glucose 4-epimerase